MNLTEKVKIENIEDAFENFNCNTELINELVLICKVDKHSREVEFQFCELWQVEKKNWQGWRVCVNDLTLVEILDIDTSILEYQKEKAELIFDWMKKQN